MNHEFMIIARLLFQINNPNHAQESSYHTPRVGGGKPNMPEEGLFPRALHLSKAFSKIRGGDDHVRSSLSDGYFGPSSICKDSFDLTRSSNIFDVTNVTNQDSDGLITRLIGFSQAQMRNFR